MLPYLFAKLLVFFGTVSDNEIKQHVPFNIISEELSTFSCCCDIYAALHGQYYSLILKNTQAKKAIFIEF